MNRIVDPSEMAKEFVEALKLRMANPFKYAVKKSKIYNKRSNRIATSCHSENNTNHMIMFEIYKEIFPEAHVTWELRTHSFLIYVQYLYKNQWYEFYTILDAWDWLEFSIDSIVFNVKMWAKCVNMPKVILQKKLDLLGSYDIKYVTGKLLTLAYTIELPIKKI